MTTPTTRNTDGPIVIAGAGMAAAKAAGALRDGGYDGPLVMVGDEPHLPYERPPLSKGYLAGETELDAVFVNDVGWYDKFDIDLRLGTTVTGLDPAARRVLVGGTPQPYAKLLLATGSTPRRLPLVEDSGAPMTYLRTIEDSDRIRSALTPGARIVIIGGGWIGLEVASAARGAGCEVTLVESMDLPLLRVLGQEMGEVFASLHKRHGVDLRLAASVVDVRRSDAGAVVHLGDGSRLESDLVVVGVGVQPNDRLAADAGLETDGGIVVDEQLRTSHPDVFAAGDVASALHPVLGTRIRVEHWDNAIGQGAVAGSNLAGGSVVYDRLPYFFTDQYDLGMEYVGHVGAEGHDEVVVRGDTGENPVFTALWLRDGIVRAGMHANDWDATDSIRALVGKRVDASRLRDRSVPLADLTGGAA